jgi:hypothetical protein
MIEAIVLTEKIKMCQNFCTEHVRSCGRTSGSCPRSNPSRGSHYIHGTFSYFSSVPPRKFPYSASNYVMAAFFHVFYTSLFTENLTQTENILINFLQLLLSTWRTREHLRRGQHLGVTYFRVVSDVR